MKSATEWRLDMTKFLTSLGVIVLNPLAKPLFHDDINWSETDHREERILAKQNKDYDKLREIMKPIRAVDLRFLDKSDFLVAHFDINAAMIGTLEEIFIGNQQRKPVILKTAGTKQDMPDWMHGCLRHELFFETWDSLKLYVIDVNSGKDSRDFSGRWKHLNMEQITIKALNKGAIQTI